MSDYDPDSEVLHWLINPDLVDNDVFSRLDDGTQYFLRVSEDKNGNWRGNIYTHSKTIKYDFVAFPEYAVRCKTEHEANVELNRNFLIYIREYKYRKKIIDIPEIFNDTYSLEYRKVFKDMNTIN